MTEYSFAAEGDSTASPEAVFAVLADGTRWNEWAGWFVRESFWEREGTPAPGGVGAIKRLGGKPIYSREETVEYDPPKNEGVCDQDGSKLVQRDDDKPETVKHRLEVYHQQTEPLIAYYEERGLLRRFDGTRSQTEVHDHIRATIATLRLEDEL